MAKESPPRVLRFATGFLNIKVLLNSLTLLYMKSVLKYAGAIAGLVILAALVLLAIDYYEYRKSPEYEARKIVKQLEEEERNDPYGGSTPEETLHLLANALEKGAIDLAAKYFLLEQQAKWLENFRVAKENNHLDLYVNEVKEASDGKEIFAKHYLYTITEKGVATFSISLVFNEKSSRWKVEDL